MRADGQGRRAFPAVRHDGQPRRGHRARLPRRRGYRRGDGHISTTPRAAGFPSWPAPSRARSRATRHARSQTTSRRRIRGAADLALAPTRLVCLENTHNAAGGTVMPLATMAAIQAVGARTPAFRCISTAPACSMPRPIWTCRSLRFCRHVDSVWFALCKGLGGPVGALLAGDKAFMSRRAAPPRCWAAACGRPA